MNFKHSIGSPVPFIFSELLTFIFQYIVYKPSEFDRSLMLAENAKEKQNQSEHIETREFI